MSTTPVTPSWEEISQVFAEAAALAPEARRAFLDERCAGKPDVRAEVESLLEQDAVAAANGYLKPPPVASAMFLGPPAGAVVGGFTVLRRIGVGGMSSVHEALQANPARRVALKILPPVSADQRARERFAAEAEMLARMNHPSIAHVYTAGVDGDTPFIAMELVEEPRSITEHARHEALSTADSLRLFRKVCSAIAHGHGRGVIHRDLKPSNLLVGRGGTPKVIDFGIARAIDVVEGAPRKTRIGELHGTLQYLSPEQAEGHGHEADAQTDVYALGLVLYEILCGERAHDVAGKPLTQALRSITERTVPLARSVRPDLPAEIEWILTKALESDRARRYRSVEDLDGDLARFLAHEPVHARPRSRAYEARLWIRRHPTASAVIGVLAVSLVAVAALALSAAARKREVFRLADTARLLELDRDADALWPAWPENADALRGWLARADALLANLDDHRATLASLRARAKPRTEAEREEQAAGHPRAAELAAVRAELAWRRDALARRTSEDGPALVAADVERYAGLDWVALNDSAMGMLGPTLQEQRDPALVLALARRALALEGAQRAKVLDTIAWAHHAAGDETEAERQVSLAQAAGAGEPPELVAALDGSADALRLAIDAAESQAGLEEAERAIRALERREAELVQIVAERRVWKFEDESDTWWHARLSELVSGLVAFADPETGLVRGRSIAHGPGVRLRLDHALEQQRLAAEHDAAWREALATIASDPRFGGHDVVRVFGFVPLGADGESGLQEFADVATGSIPVRDASGALVIAPDSAVVFVLVPGGSFLFGSQATDRAGPHYDVAAKPNEHPVRTVALDPFYLSKYELTQAQWRHVTGSNPSEYADGSPVGSGRAGEIPEMVEARNPVESVSWDMCDAFLKRQCWNFPTEAQWEYAARAGTDTIWSTGDSAASLQDFANVADRHGKEFGGSAESRYEMEIDDGRAVHAPVGSYRPNRFGLHDMHGNVFERCRDHFTNDHFGELAARDGLALDTFDGRRAVRGGSYETSSLSARSAQRNGDAPNSTAPGTGIRPARSIAP